jgi:uncharacterized protein
MGHTRRVVANARRLAHAEQARLAVVIPAAWLHDCVLLPKDSPQRWRAAQMAAEQATALLHAWGYPGEHLPAIAHAIEAHSFSAGVPPRTLEAQVVQDADRLDALGAIGIARCMALGGHLRRPLYDAQEPFPVQRCPDDSANILDHFFVKLLPISESMQTASGRREASQRRAFMQAFLAQLRAELEA